MGLIHSLKLHLFSSPPRENSFWATEYECAAWDECGTLCNIISGLLLFLKAFLEDRIMRE